MPFRLPLRTRSARVKSPAISSSRRRTSPSRLHEHSSSTSTHRPTSSYDEPAARLGPSSSVRRSRSHEGGPRPRPAPSAQRHDGPQVLPPRRRSTHRSSLSPPPSSHHPPSSLSRPERQTRQSQRRDSPSPYSRRTSSQEHYSRGRADHEHDGRGRSTSTRPSDHVSPPRAHDGRASLPSPTFASGGAGRPLAPVPAYAAPPAQPHRSSTPTKYKPGSASGPSPHLRRTSQTVGGRQQKPERRDDHGLGHRPSHSGSASPAAHSHHEEGGSMFSGITSTLATHTAISALAKYAGTAKEWAGRLNELKGAPEEIQSLTERVTTARDTIAQIEGSIKARPDLLEDETGQALKKQIEESIESTSKTLNDMTKMLSGLTAQFMGRGAAWEGLNDLWTSYQYKSEGEEKVKAADEELQRQLTVLSTLMVNLYSRALMKQPSPAQTPIQTPQGPQTPQPMQQPMQQSMQQQSPALAPAPVYSKASSPAVTPPVPVPVPVPTAAPPAPIPVPVVAPAPAPLPVSAPTAAPPPPVPASSPGAANEPPILPNDFRTPNYAAESPGTEAPSIETPAQDSPRHVPPQPAAAAAAAAPPIHTAPVPPGLPPTPSKVALDEAAIETGRRASLAPEPVEEARTSKDGGHRGRSRSKPADQDPRDRLLDAAWDGNLAAVAEALQSASPNSCDKRGLTPLHLASERDNLAIAILLLDRGANAQARANGGRTPLHLASRFASADTVELLVERGGADPNTQTADGRTALHYAASSAEDHDEERREVLRVLRDYGADPTIEDRKGETARDVAQRKDYWDAAATLRRAEKKWEGGHHQNWLQRHGLMK